MPDLEVDLREKARNFRDLIMPIACLFPQLTFHCKVLSLPNLLPSAKYIDVSALFKKKSHFEFIFIPYSLHLIICRATLLSLKYSSPTSNYRHKP
jgi:hypothetical protein